MARSASTKRRGRRRVRLEIERAGISADAANRAVDEVFSGVDDRAAIEAIIDRRLKGRPPADDRERMRLYRHLIGQGFEAEVVLAALKTRKDH